jgi:hypothetical protein
MTIAGRILRAIGSLFQNLRKETKRLVPVAINVVEGIKTVMDSPVDDILLAVLKQAIPGTADDILISKIQGVVKEWLPKVLFELYAVKEIADIQDANEQLKVILARFKLSSDESKNIFYHGFCSLILEKLSDGKIEWSEAVLISEYYFKNLHDGTVPSA